MNLSAKGWVQAGKNLASSLPFLLVWVPPSSVTQICGMFPPNNRINKIPHVYARYLAFSWLQMLSHWQPRLATMSLYKSNSMSLEFSNTFSSIYLSSLVITSPTFSSIFSSHTFPSACSQYFKVDLCSLIAEWYLFYFIIWTSLNNVLLLSSHTVLKYCPFPCSNWNC